jgi:hypothetical protein
MPTATPFNNLITFSRGSNATVTGPNGLIQWAPSNLVLNSQDIEAAAWTKNSSSATANNATAPDGTQTADTWVPTSSGTTAGVRLIQTVTTPVGFVQTASVYVKSAGKRWVYMTTPAALSPAHNCWFDLQNGVVGTMGGAVLAATITPAGSGWFRITTTSATTLSSNYIFLSTSDADNSDVVTANGTGIQVWGAQLELGSTATTYNNTSVRNLLGFSEAFDNASGFVKTRCSMVVGAHANPLNGLFNAQKMMEDTTASSTHTITRNVTAPAAIYNYSIYAKAAERSVIRIRDSVNSVDGYFNLATGVASNATNATLSMVAVGNGWYRCSATSTAAVTNPEYGVRLASAVGTDTYTGDGNSGVYIYGAQLSNSASLDPYVPTPGAAPSSTAYYGPRFDYDPVTLAARGFLVEEARTNSITYSADFANAAWTKSSCTVTANQGTAPDDTNTLTLLQFSAQFGRLQQGSLTAGTVYTFSIWCRVASGTRVYSLYDAVGNPLGSFTATTTLTRYSVTFTAPATSTLYAVQDRNAGPFVDTFIWGAQLEAGAFATSYIPTIASTVTRSADVATITGSLFSQWYNRSEGSYIASFSALWTGAAAASYGVLGMDSSNTKRVIQMQSGVTQPSVRDAVTTLFTANSISAGSNNVASAYNSTTKAIVLAGGTVASDAVDAAYSVSTSLNIGAFGANPLNGHIRSIRYVPARAADFQLQAIST